MTWELLARDNARVVLGVLQGGSFDLTLKLNEVGAWSLSIPREACPLGWPSPGSGLVFLRDGKVVASGQWDDERYEWTATEGEATGPGRYTLTGDTDLGRLAYRLVYPNPAAAWTAQTVTHYVTTDVASTVVRRLVINNAGVNALAGRIVPGLVLNPGDTPTGATVTARERFTPLLDACRSAALTGGGVVFDVLDDLAGGLKFSTRAPADKTTTARFGVDLGNVTSLVVERTAPTGTTVLIAGIDPGVSRETWEQTDTAATATWGRREVFADKRSADSDATLAERQAEYAAQAAEELADDGEQTAVAATVVDTPATAWGRDYGLGDKVSVATPYGQVADLVRQVDISVDAKGVETVSSTIGTTQAATRNPLAKTVRRLTQRLTQLERAL